MNIEYDESTNQMGFTILCGIFLIVEFLTELLIYITTGFNIFVVILLFSNILTLALLILTIYNNKNINVEKIKSKGEKIRAFIIGAGIINKNKQFGTYYCLYIRYNGRKMKINVNNNEEFKILNLLLNPYPIHNKKVEIPVDMYIYKGNRYVDIENVDLTKIEGYNEAKKIVEEKEK